jgi:hypothetical protein
MPILHCEVGNHDYFRDSQRGRLPKNCKDHMPEKDIKIISSVAKSLDMAKTHEYEFSPHTQELLGQLKAATEKPTTRELRCEHGDGHMWQAGRRRGRPPRFCPEHLPSVPQKPAQRESNTKNQSTLLAAILEKPAAQICSCGILSTTSPAEMRQMGGGCTMPNFVCSVLDSCRRAVGI